MSENPLEVPGIRWFFGSLATNLFVLSLVVVFRSSLSDGLMKLKCDFRDMLHRQIAGLHMVGTQ